MWFLYLLAGSVLIYEGISRYQNRPRRFTDELYEESRRERLRHLAQRGDESHV